MSASRLAAALTVVTCAGWLHGAEAPGKCAVVIGGRTLSAKTHTIVIPARPTPQEAHAAKELRAHLARLTGQVLATVPDGRAGASVPIVVGTCHTTLAGLGVKVDFASLGTEGIVIRTKGPALVLAGNKRGVLYAVYSFLEDTCGIRWLTPDCTVIPKAGTFKIPDLNVRYVPPLEYRATDYPCHRDADFAVRNKYNGTQTRLDEPRGGKIAYSHFVHTFNTILDPRRHFAKHPEYFSMIKGKRTGGRTQLCLTNPDVIAIAKEKSAGGSRPHRTPRYSASRRTTGTTTASAPSVPPWPRRKAHRPDPLFTSSTPLPKTSPRTIRTRSSRRWPTSTPASRRCTSGPGRT